MSFATTIKLQGTAPIGGGVTLDLSMSRIERNMKTRWSKLPRPAAFGDTVQVFGAEQQEIVLDGFLASNQNEISPPTLGYSKASNVVPTILYWQQTNQLIIYTESGDGLDSGPSLGNTVGGFTNTSNFYVASSEFTSEPGAYFLDLVRYRIKLVQKESQLYGVT